VEVSTSRGVGVCVCVRVCVCERERVCDCVCLSVCLCMYLCNMYAANQLFHEVKFDGATPTVFSYLERAQV